MKLKRTSGPPTKYDWLSLRDEFEASGAKTLQGWCGGKGVNYQYASKRFAEIGRLEEEQHLSRAKRRLSQLAPLAVEKMATLIDSEDENVQLKASLGVLDRTGNSPQAAAINLQMNTAVQINIPPMFGEESRADLAKMLGADEVEES